MPQTACLLSHLWIGDCWPLSTGSKYYLLDSVLQKLILVMLAVPALILGSKLFGSGHDPAVPFPSPTTTLKLLNKPNQLSMSRRNQQAEEQPEVYNLDVSDPSSEESDHEENPHKRRAPGLTKLSGIHLPLIGTPTAPS